jgi:sugar fermentation stimulation protein A
MIKLNQTWVGIHSALANNMVAGAFEHGYIDDLAGFSHIKREVKVSNETRIDFELTFDKAMQEEFIQPVKKSKSNQIKGANKAAHCTSSSSSQSCLVEVKSVTMGVVDQASGSTWAVFPDTVSERAQKHALTLLDHVKAGGKAAILYLIQRDDCSHFSISSLDPSYGKIVSIAAAGGVEILPYYCRLCPDKGTVELLGKLPFVDTYKDSATQESLDVKAPKSKTSKAKRTSELKKRKAEK